MLHTLPTVRTATGKDQDVIYAHITTQVFSVSERDTQTDTYAHMYTYVHMGLIRYILEIRSTNTVIHICCIENIPLGPLYESTCRFPKISMVCFDAMFPALRRRLYCIFYNY